MFTRYQYTCPDVIHMRKMRRNTAIVTTIVYAAVSVAAWIWAEKSLDVVATDPAPTEEV